MIHIIGPHYKPPENSLIIDTTSRSTNWSRGLSPFICGPVVLYGGHSSFNVENGWQYTKCYSEHLDENKNPTEAYFKWAKSGWLSRKANRYPMGRNAIPEFSYWNGNKYGYIEARKKIYIPLYSSAVRSTNAFQKLKNIYENYDGTLYLFCFDAHSLTPGTFSYDELWNNSDIKVGHAYVLAAMLENLI
jgi:hypothetical protein